MSGQLAAAQYAKPTMNARGRVPVAGVMMPFKWTYGWVSGREEYVITEYQPNAPVEAKNFAQPVQRVR